MCVCVSRSCLVPAEARSSCQIPWDWSYYYVGARNQTWVPWRAAGALHHRDTSLDLKADTFVKFPDFSTQILGFMDLVENRFSRFSQGDR